MLSEFYGIHALIRYKIFWLLLLLFHTTLQHIFILQIITGNADGSAHVFYDPNISVRGAKLCVVKESKKRAVDDYEINRPIIAPHSLAIFRDDRPKSTKRKREKLRKDPVASHRPGSYFFILFHKFNISKLIFFFFFIRFTR